MLDSPRGRSPAAVPVLGSLPGLVFGQLGAVHFESLLGDREPRRSRFEVCEEELQQGEISELGRLPRWTAEPRSHGPAPGVCDREEPPPLWSSVKFRTALHADEHDPTAGRESP